MALAYVLVVVVGLIILIVVVGAVSRRNVPQVIETYEDVQPSFDPNIIKAQVFDMYYEMVVVHPVEGDPYLEVRTHKNKQIIAMAYDDLVVHPFKQQQQQKGQ